MLIDQLATLITNSSSELTPGLTLAAQSKAKNTGLHDYLLVMTFKR